MPPKWVHFAGRASTAFAVLAIGIVLSAAAAYWTAKQVQREIRLKFENAVTDGQTAIDSRIRAYSDVLLGVRGLFIASDSVTRGEFRDYIDSLELRRRYPGIQGINYGQRISAAEERTFVAMVRKDTSVDPRGYPRFAIKPSGNRPEYVVVKYVEPAAGNQVALGLDLAGDAVRLAALERTRDSGRITASGSIALSLDPRRHPGFAMRLPVYRKGMPLVTVAQRREAFSGMVSAAFIVIDLMRGVLSEPFLRIVRVRIHDAGFLDNPNRLQPPAAENLMFDGDRLLPAPSAQQAADEGELAGLSSMSSLEVGGRRWNVHFSARTEFASSSGQWLPLAVMLGGVIISLLLFGLIRSLASVGRRALALAANITEDLRRSEARFRSLTEMSSDFYWESDAEHRLTQRTAASTSSVVSLVHRPTQFGERRWEVPYLSPEESGWRAHRAVLDAHRPFREFEFSRPGAGGVERNLSISGDPMFDASGTFQGYRGIGTDITERKRAELRQAMEHDVTRLLSESGTPEEVMPNIIRTICEALGFACGARLLRDEDGRAMRCVDTWSVPSAEVMEFIAADRRPMYSQRMTGGLLGRVWASGEPIWITDVAEDASLRRAPFAAKAGLHAAFAFPILLGDEVLGVMEFFSRASRPPDEVLLQSMGSIGAQIGQFMARRLAEERVYHLAHYDELTGLPNRSMFNQRLSHALAQVRRNNKPLAILFIDLDHFKNINDTLGHEAGDRVLKEVAQRLQGCLREGDTVGRLGGDEFVVLIEELPEPLHVAAVAQKILAAVVKPFIVGAKEFKLSASIGISTYPDDSEEMQGLLKNADIAMYRAKEQGNNYQFHSTLMNIHTVERLALESGLRRALERNEFLLHYQPRVDIGSGRITGMEALLRWQRPGQELVAPAQFIALAEETGLIVPIGEWVLKTACARNQSWREQGLPPLRIAVNLSARQFAHENLLQDVARALAETGLDPAALELDITESMVMHDAERAVTLLSRLKHMGIHLSIDDFGTGYSSLSYLKRFPLDSVKIDRSFIRDIPGDADDAAITRAIIAMAHSLRLKVIAEGVETAEQLSFLREHGCDEMQGYYFSKPLPEDELLRLLQNSVV